MSSRIPDTVVDDILGRTDIVELIAGYIPLKRAGRNFKANCPFHQEKTPSFMVSVDRQIYHCFGCAAGGNAISFLMQHERLEFREALALLAQRVGVTLPTERSTDDKTVSVSAQLYGVCETACAFFEAQLSAPAGKAASVYCTRRGIAGQVANTLRLGAASDKWDSLIIHARAKGIPLSLLEKAGLVLSKEGGGYYDRFRGRLIFPICDIRSRPIGFGGRVLVQDSGDTAKYMNSPETPLYTKGRHLYGLHLTRDAIRERDAAVVVEGYLDFIIPYQAGIDNLVASLGTALTIEQVRLLKRYTHNVIMIYDPDEAGQAAALRSIDTFLEEEMHLRIVSLPEGNDPDLFVRTYGLDALKEKIAQAKGFFEYELGFLMRTHDIHTPEGKIKIASQVLRTIRKVKNSILRAEYLKRLSDALGVSEVSVLEEFGRMKEPVAGQGNRVPSIPQTPINPTEQLLIKLMLEENDLIERIRQCLEPADFQDTRTCKIVTALFKLVEEGKRIEASMLIHHIEDGDTLRCICESAFLPDASSHEQRERVVADCIKRLKAQRLGSRKKELHDQIKIAQRTGDEGCVHRLMQEFHELIKKKEGNRG